MESNRDRALVKRETEAMTKFEPSDLVIVQPSTDVIETTEAFVIRLDIPGADRERISTNVEDGQLIVKAFVESHHPVEPAKFLLRETTGKQYRRVFRLGNEVDSNGAVADFRDGVLTITLPKKPQAMAREIRIQ